MAFLKYLISLLIGLIIGSLITQSNSLNTSVRLAYLEEQFPRLINDVSFLAKLVDKNIKRKKMLSILRKNSDGSYIQDIKVHSHHDDKRVKSSLSGNGFIFYFDSSEQLVRIEHWHGNAGTILE